MCRIRARGRSPCSATACSDAISSAAAPSAIWLDSAAVITPPSPAGRSGASLPIRSSEVSRRGHSSSLTAPYRSISSANSPASMAAIARWWLASAYSSISARPIPHLAAIRSAALNWEIS